MPYAKNFAHDVFVSYAHVDNTPERADETGWVTAFSKQLSVRLLKRLGTQPSVWHDPRLDRTEIFDDAIEKAVRGSAVFVTLVSNSYLNSEYCAQEQKWFSDSGNLRVGDHRRVVPVLLYNIPFGRWPEICQGLTGFQFHESEGDELGRPIDADDDRFEDRQWEMVDEIARLLDAVNAEAATAPQPEAENATEGAFRIFLAHSDTLARDRNYLRRELSDAGIDVMRRIPPPMDLSLHDDAVRTAIADADLTVHLLDSDPGNLLDEDQPESSIAVAQTNLALATETPQVVLFPESFEQTDIVEPSYATFIEDLHQRPRDDGNLEVIKAGSRGEILDALLRKKETIERARSAPQTIAGGDATAFIDLHVSDLVHVSGLLGFLAEKRVVPLTVPSVDLSPREGLAVFEENLQKAGIFIVVFGSVARSWVEHRLQEAFKLLLSLRKRTPIAVYVAPPGKDPRALNFTLCDVLDNSGDFDPATVEPLLAKAGWA